MSTANSKTMQEQKNDENNDLSPEVRAVLEEEANEAEIQAAIDAAAEEGRTISREEAVQILQTQQNNPTQ